MAKRKSVESSTPDHASHPQPRDITSALNRLADVAEKFYAKLYPEHVPQTAVISRKSDEKKKLYEDKMPEGWESEQPVDIEPGRFEKQVIESGSKASRKQARPVAPRS